MNKLINSLEVSIKAENWYSALIIALTLPDIAGKIEYPIATSGQRYANWFDKYVGHNYKAQIGSDKTEHTFLSGNDCYALRCSYLHEGITDITTQRAREILDDFIFVAPSKGLVIHCNQMNNKLQLQVDIFCNHIIEGLTKWLADISGDKTKQDALRKLIDIHQIK